MSDEGRAYVKAHSPFTGNAWWLHYVLGDLVNWQHDYRVFISDRKLCEEYPFKQATVTRARADLIRKGYLIPLSKTTAPGKPREYQFVFLGAEWMAKGNGPHHEHRSEKGRSSPTEATVLTTSTERSSPAQGDLLPTEDEPKGSEVAPKPRSQLDRHAQGLAELAFRQRVKPVTRGGFPAVLARIKSELHAGTTVQAIRRTIEAGDITWTADGLRTAISKANPRARPRAGGDGDARSLPELVEAAAQAEQQERNRK